MSLGLGMSTVALGRFGHPGECDPLKGSMMVLHFFSKKAAAHNLQRETQSPPSREIYVTSYVSLDKGLNLAVPLLSHL